MKKHKTHNAPRHYAMTHLCGGVAKLPYQNDGFMRDIINNVPPHHKTIPFLRCWFVVFIGFCCQLLLKIRITFDNMSGATMSVYRKITPQTRHATPHNLWRGVVFYNVIPP